MAYVEQWPDLDFAAGREIRVARAFSDGRLDTPKSGQRRAAGPWTKSWSAAGARIPESGA